MNWLAFAIVAWVSLGLEVGLRDVLRYGQSPIAPSLVIPLMVWVSMAAPPKRAAWAALLLGVLLDLTWLAPLAGGTGRAFVIGPYALGLLLAAQLVIAMRGFVIRRVFITLGVLSALAAAVTHIVIVAIMFVRSLMDDTLAFDPAAQLQVRLLSSLWTGGAALVLAFLLNRLEPIMGFEGERRHRFGRS